MKKADINEDKLMRNLITFAPIVVFVVVYCAAQVYPAEALAALSFLGLPQLTGAFYPAIVALMTVAVGQIILLSVLRMRITSNEWMKAASIVFFGGVTLMLQMKTAFLF